MDFGSHEELGQPNLPIGRRSAAPVQSAEEQVLQEAQEQKEEPPKQKMTCRQELEELIHKDREQQIINARNRRKEFHNLVDLDPSNKSIWIEFARWEEEESPENLKYEKASMLWKIALRSCSGDFTILSEYVSFELRNGFVGNARKLMMMAIKSWAKVDKVWHLFIHMEEELIGDITSARQISDWWTKYHPENLQGWLSYIKFELRHNEIDRARAIFERFVERHPKALGARIWFADIEVNNGDFARARNCYEQAVDKVMAAADDNEEEGEAEQLFLAFAEFEEKCKEIKRARHIYQISLDHILCKGGRAESLLSKFAAFEKQYGGDREGTEDYSFWKKRFEYEDEVRNNPLNYGAWIKYAQLERSLGETERARSIFERAVDQFGPNMPELIGEVYNDFDLSKGDKAKVYHV